MKISDGCQRRRSGVCIVNFSVSIIDFEQLNDYWVVRENNRNMF